VMTTKDVTRKQTESVPCPTAGAAPKKPCAMHSVNSTTETGTLSCLSGAAQNDRRVLTRPYMARPPLEFVLERVLTIVIFRALTFTGKLPSIARL